MSISQIAPFLTGISEYEPLPKYYFMYEDHFSHEAFQKHFVATKRITFGFLKDWTWHINEKHKPNIRFTFKEHFCRPQGPVVAPATQFAPRPAQVDGTFGFVMELNPELKSVLKRVYEVTKVAMIQDICLYLKKPNGEVAQFVEKALVYWDPHYTADGLRKNILANERQREKWKKGLMMLKRLGVPDGWLNAVQRRLVGERVDPEPLFSTFPRRPRPLMQTNYVQRVQHNHHRHEKRPDPQHLCPRDPQQIVPTPSSDTPNVQRHPVIQGAMGPPPRLMLKETMAQPTPAIQGQAPMGQNRIPMRSLPIIQHQPAMRNLPGQDMRPTAQHYPAIRNQMAQNRSLQTMSIAQRDAAIQAYILRQGQSMVDPDRVPQGIYAQMVLDQRTLPISGMKRKAESEDRLTEELKRMKRDGHAAGKLPLQ